LRRLIAPSFDWAPFAHLVGDSEQPWRHRNAECLGRTGISNDYLTIGVNGIGLAAPAGIEIAPLSHDTLNDHVSVPCAALLEAWRPSVVQKQHS
jgi:hypothetical protein